MIYIWSIDLAENLNWFVCWVLMVEGGHIRIKTVKKARKALYPELEAMLTTGDNSFKTKYPPKEIWTDYTNEKSFSEWLETRFHPSFANFHSKDYKKWRMVFPVISSQPKNLEMKQNAAHLMQPNAQGNSIFQWPDPKRTRPETGIIIAEAQEQMLREAAKTMRSGAGMTRPVFPKPTGYDNDLIRALELGLMGARKYITAMSNLSGKIEIHGSKLHRDPKPTPEEEFQRTFEKRLTKFHVTGTSYKFS